MIYPRDFRGAEAKKGGKAMNTQPEQLTQRMARGVSRAIHLAESWTLQAVDHAAWSLTTTIDVWLDRLQQGLQAPGRKILGRIPDGD